MFTQRMGKIAKKKKFQASLFPGLLNDYFEFSQSVKRFVGVLATVNDPFQNSAGDGMLFGHPTRDSLDFVATTCRFLHDGSD